MTFCVLKGERSASEVAIFNNAKRLIAKYGLSWVTLDDIALGYKKEQEPQPESSGAVSKALVRKLFISKENLLKEISDSAWEALVKKVNQIVDSSGTPTKKLERLIVELPHFLAEDLDACGVLIRERYPQSEHKEQLKGSGGARRCLGMLEKLLNEIKKEGNLREDVQDITSVVHCLYGALEHGMLNVYLRFENSSKDSQVMRIVDAHKRVDSLVVTLKAMTRGILENFDE